MGGLSISPGSRRKRGERAAFGGPGGRNFDDDARNFEPVQPAHPSEPSQDVKASSPRGAPWPPNPPRKGPPKVHRNKIGLQCTFMPASAAGGPTKKKRPVSGEFLHPASLLPRGGATDLLRFCSSIRGGVPGDPQKCKAVQIIEAPARCARSSLTLSMPDTRVASSASPLCASIDRCRARARRRLLCMGTRASSEQDDESKEKGGRSKTRTMGGWTDALRLHEIDRPNAPTRPSVNPTPTALATPPH